MWYTASEVDFFDYLWGECAAWSLAMARGVEAAAEGWGGEVRLWRNVDQSQVCFDGGSLCAEREPASAVEEREGCNDLGGSFQLGSTGRDVAGAIGGAIPHQWLHER